MEDCTIQVADTNCVMSLPNCIQLVESELPLSEANNYDKLSGTFLFRQIVPSYETTLHCLFCENERTFHCLADLEKHYQVFHGLTVNTSKAEFNGNCVSVCIPSDVNEESRLNSLCRFCNVNLNTLFEVRDHYLNVHNKAVRFLPISDATLANRLFYCSLCESHSNNYLFHHQHMKVTHNLVLRNWKSRLCMSRINVKNIRSSLQLGTVQRPVYSTHVHKKDMQMMQSSNVRTGPNSWTCPNCLHPYSNTHMLMLHLLYCYENFKSKTNETTSNNLSNIKSSRARIFSHMEKFRTKPADILARKSKIMKAFDLSKKICSSCPILSKEAADVLINWNQIHSGKLPIGDERNRLAEAANITPPQVLSWFLCIRIGGCDRHSSSAFEQGRKVDMSRTADSECEPCKTPTKVIYDSCREGQDVFELTTLMQSVHEIKKLEDGKKLKDEKKKLKDEKKKLKDEKKKLKAGKKKSKYGKKKSGGRKKKSGGGKKKNKVKQENSKHRKINAFLQTQFAAFVRSPLFLQSTLQDRVKMAKETFSSSAYRLLKRTNWDLFCTPDLLEVDKMMHEMKI